MKKFIFITLYLLTLSVLQAQSFVQADLARLIKAHPLMKDFDAKRGCFNNTPNEIKDVLLLEDELDDLVYEIEQLNEERECLVCDMLTNASDEGAAWGKLAEVDDKIKAARKQQIELKSLIQSGGVPSNETFTAVLSRLFNDTAKSLSKGQITLNKLPKTHYPLRPAFFNFRLSDFFKTANPALLGDYLKNTAAVGLLFSSSDDAILYERKR